MTAEEWADRLLDEHPLEYAVGSKHHDPRRCREVIAAAIRAAVLAEREAIAAAAAEESQAAAAGWGCPAHACPAAAAALSSFAVAVLDRDQP